MPDAWGARSQVAEADVPGRETRFGLGKAKVGREDWPRRRQADGSMGSLAVTAGHQGRKEAGFSDIDMVLDDFR